MRGAPARTLDEAAVTQEVATVVRLEGPADPDKGSAGILVRGRSAERRARRATSCLLDPAVGDRVLVAVVDGGAEAFVLAVLERPGEVGERAPATVSVEGDLALKAVGGRVEITASEGVSMVSPADVSVVSGELRVRSPSASLLLDGVTFLGKAVRAELGRAMVSAEALDQRVGRLTQRLKRALRFVEEGEHVRAESLDYAAEKSVNLRGENTIVTAKELVKVDGGQIHLG